MREEGVIDEASGEKGTSKEKAVQRGMKIGRASCRERV